MSKPYTPKHKQAEEQTSPAAASRTAPSRDTAQNTAPLSDTPQNSASYKTEPRNTPPHNIPPRNTEPRNTAPRNTAPRNTASNKKEPRDTKTQKPAVRPTASRRYTPADKKKQPRGKYILGLFGVLALGFAGFFMYTGVIAPALQGSVQEEVPDESDSALSRTGIVSFVAVGDNLPEIAIGNYGDANAGVIGDGLYDYRPIFAPIKPYIEGADLAYICFEIHAGGDNIQPRGWPSFNTTEAMIDAVEDTGFNMIASATNHAYDWGPDALANSASIWEQRDVLFTGTASSEAIAQEIKTIERNGIVFSLLSYTYGINGYDESEIPPYAVNYIHEEKIQNDIARAREVSDVVLVALHWGTEYYAEADDYQRYYAQIIADAGADVILGSHPHVVGPLEWVEGASGNKTLVAFSLGNFLSHHDYPEPINELGGMLSCDFVKDRRGVRIENIKWTPVVNHSEEGAFAVYALQDYSEELAVRSRVLKDLDDPIAWLRESSIRIVGPYAGL